mmetsp:Transcript_57600/g.135541  ORF Transcript_57600/g.135541 Transcript_57600/m.135541 type:complete len:207 (+) Transcript_57600:254-874(+)
MPSTLFHGTWISELSSRSRRLCRVVVDRAIGGFGVGSVCGCPHPPIPARSIFSRTHRPAQDLSSLSGVLLSDCATGVSRTQSEQRRCRGNFGSGVGRVQFASCRWQWGGWWSVLRSRHHSDIKGWLEHHGAAPVAWVDDVVWVSGVLTAPFPSRCAGITSMARGVHSRLAFVNHAGILYAAQGDPFFAAMCASGDARPTPSHQRWH